MIRGARNTRAHLPAAAAAALFADAGAPPVRSPTRCIGARRVFTVMCESQNEVCSRGRNELTHAVTRDASRA